MNKRENRINGDTALSWIKIKDIFPDPKNSEIYNPDNNEDYRLLVESIREEGILQPLLVKHHPALPGAYMIIAGHRRYQAALEVELMMLPCMVKETLTKEEVIRSKISLLATNMLTRTRTPSEKAREIRELEQLVKELRPLVPEYKGIPTRKIVAEMAEMSERQVAKYQKVNNQLAGEDRERFDSGDMTLAEAISPKKKTQVKVKFCPNCGWKL